MVFMSYELELLINGRVCRGFVSETAGSAEQTFKIIHNHKYAEIHMILDGDANFLIGGKLMKFQDRDAFLIPAGVYHCCRDIGENTRDIAFQVAADAGDFAVNRQPETVLGEIAREISVLGVGEGGGRLAALLSYVGSDFFPQPKIFEMTDTAAVIHEFISQNYNRDIKTADLAEVLNFSEKHTERLVKRFTGVTFREALTDYRLTVADFLIKNTDMRPSAAAAYVGYSTYSGFWKARRRK